MDSYKERLRIPIGKGHGLLIGKVESFYWASYRIDIVDARQCIICKV